MVSRRRPQKNSNNICANVHGKTLNYSEKIQKYTKKCSQKTSKYPSTNCNNLKPPIKNVTTTLKINK